MTKLETTSFSISVIRYNFQILGKFRFLILSDSVQVFMASFQCDSFLAAAETAIEASSHAEQDDLEDLEDSESQYVTDM